MTQAQSYNQEWVLIRNTLSNWISLILSIVILFLLTPFIVAKLGEQAYGIWVLIISLTSYYNLMNMGINFAQKRYIAKFSATNDYSRLNEVINTSLLIYSTVGGVAIFITLLLSLWLTPYFNIPEYYIEDAKTIVFIVGLDLSIAFPFSTFSGVLWGFQRFDLTNWVEIGKLILRSILIVVLLSSGYGLLTLALINLGVNIIGYCANLLVCFKICPKLRIHSQFMNKKTFHLLFNFGFHGFLSDASSQLIKHSGPIIIGIFLAPAQIGYFAIADSLATYARRMLNSATGILMPAVSRLDSLGEVHKIEELYFRGTKYLNLILFPIGFSLIIVGPIFIDLWMGENFAINSSPVLFALVIPLFFATIHSFSLNVLFGTGHYKIPTLVLVLQGVFTICLAIILVKHMGILGMAIAIAVPKLIVAPFIFSVIIYKIIGISIRKLAKESFLIPLLCILPSLGFLMQMKTSFPPTSFVMLAGEIVLMLIPFMVLSYFFCFEKDLKDKIREKLVGAWFNR